MGAWIVTGTSPRLYFTSVYFSISVSGCSTCHWAVGNLQKPMKTKESGKLGNPCPFSWKLLKANDELWVFKLGLMTIH